MKRREVDTIKACSDAGELTQRYVFSVSGGAKPRDEIIEQAQIIVERTRASHMRRDDLRAKHCQPCIERKGVIRVAASGEDALLEILDAGAEDAVEEDGEIIVYTDQKELMKVRKNLVDAGLDVKDAELQYIATTPLEITDEETSEKIMKLLDVLDDLDDVVNVHTNAEFGE